MTDSSARWLHVWTLHYSRVVSTTLSVEAKNVGQGKSKGYAGERSTQGPEKRTRLVIRPFNSKCSSPRPPTYPFRQPVFICRTPAPARTNQPSAPDARFPVLPQKDCTTFSAAPTIFGGQGRAAENKLVFSAV
jgi:hypothetical protein